MGGCYETRYSSGGGSSRSSRAPTHMEHIDSFFRSKDPKDIVKAYQAFAGENSSGWFIKTVLERRGVKTIPKEFSDIEYELKFDIQATCTDARSEEPSLVEYLGIFQFPPIETARFLRESGTVTGEGTNHFYGDAEKERLVVIEKGDKMYMKEKSPPLEMRLQHDIPYSEIVMKRTEHRYGATLAEVLAKTEEVVRAGSIYQGCVVKEKGDTYILDTHEGRIYSLTLTRATLERGEETLVQRQLELEYAGYIPGFPQFEKDSEEQIVAAMVEIAKHIGFFYRSTHVTPKWKIDLAFTNQRKYDFVRSDAPALAPKLHTGFEIVLAAKPGVKNNA